MQRSSYPHAQRDPVSQPADQLTACLLTEGEKTNVSEILSAKPPDRDPDAIRRPRRPPRHMRLRRGRGTVPAGISSGAAASEACDPAAPHKGVGLVVPRKVFTFPPPSPLAMLAAPTARLLHHHSPGAMSL